MGKDESGVEVIIDVCPIFKVGDPCPDGYNARIEWANVHMKAGLKQKKCGVCLLWHFPHELSERTIETSAFTNKHGGEKVTWINPVCKECAAK